MTRIRLILLGSLFFLPFWVSRQLTNAQVDDRPEVRFGVIESYESPEEATVLGAGWTRVRFQWAEVQPDGPGDWKPPVSDELLDSELSAGRQVVGLLIGIPEWARDEDRLPEGLWLSHDDLDNTWATFVRQVVDRYQGRVQHWIIWNEPDIQEGEIAHTWDGTVADFAQLQRIAYLAAKEVNPESVIHLSAFTFWADFYAGTDQYMARLLDEIGDDPQAAANNYYFDVATAHLYFQPNQIRILLELFTRIMSRRGLEQPIWLVETNAPPKDDPAWPVPDWTLSVTLDEQAAFMPQALAVGLAAGAERIAVYKLQDTESDLEANPEPFGLLRLDGSRRPAFTTYQTAVSQLSGAMAAEFERWDEVGQVRVDQQNQSTTVVFSRLPNEQQAEVQATDDTAQLVDMWGSSETISTTNGVYIIDLPPAYCSQSIGDYCMIGGPTYYLVQAADFPPPTQTPSPTFTPAATSTPTITPTETPPASVTPLSTAPPSPTIKATTIASLSTKIGDGNSAEPETPESQAAGGNLTANVGLLALGGAFVLVLAVGLVWMIGNRHE